MSKNQGYIIGAILLIGHLSSHDYIPLADETVAHYIKLYKQQKCRSVKCYPIVATIAFQQPILGIEKGNVSAMKINTKLQNILNEAIGNESIHFFQRKLTHFDVTKSTTLQYRILILRKDHIINTFLGWKSAEFRMNSLNNALLPKITNLTDLKKLKKYKLWTRQKEVARLKEFVNKTKNE